MDRKSQTSKKTKEQGGHPDMQRIYITCSRLYFALLQLRSPKSPFIAQCCAHKFGEGEQLRITSTAN